MLNPNRTRSLRRLLRAVAALTCLAAFLAGRPARGSELDDAINRFLAGGPRSRARVGVHVVALGSGRVIYRRNATDRFIAASNEKLITAAVALEVLGEDYVFETSLQPAGEVRDGVLRGALVLRGGGDPTIGGRGDEEGALDIFRRWARALHSNGLRRIAGDVVADDSFFDRQWYHPDWSRPQAWKWYFTAASAVSINDNCVTVTVKPGPAPGKPARVSVEPASAPVEIDNRCETSSRRHAIWFERSPGTITIKVGGYVKTTSAGYSHLVTVGNPPLYAARVLEQALRAEGIEVDGRARVVAGGGARLGSDTVLYVRRAELLPVLRRMVRDSHNHYAEQVMKAVGAHGSGRGSWEAGTSRAAQMLREMGFRNSEFNLADGSGLSRNNELSPALLTTLLLHVQRSPHRQAFESLLAVAGRDGTLDDRLADAPYAGNVRAKTGYLSGVGALSGYANTRSGIRVAFSILVNDQRNPPGTYSMRGTVDPICRAIVDHAR